MATGFPLAPAKGRKTSVKNGGDCLGSEGYLPAERERADAIDYAGNIKLTAATLIALLNAEQTVSNFRKVRDIRRRANRIRESQFNRLKDTFWAHELEFLEEYGGVQEQDTIEEIAIRLSGRIRADIAGPYAAKLRELRCNLSRFCSSANDRAIQDFMMEHGRAIAFGDILASNLAFAKFQAENDVNMDRRLKAVAVGQGLMGQAASFYEKAGSIYGRTFANSAQQLNSALERIGYEAAWKANAEGAYRAENYLEAFMTDIVNEQGKSTVGPVPGVVDTGIAPNTQYGKGFGTSDGYGPGPYTAAASAESFNEGIVGNKSLARYGKKVYPVRGGEGGTVEVDMSDFGLRWTDHLAEGDS